MAAGSRERIAAAGRDARRRAGPQCAMAPPDADIESDDMALDDIALGEAAIGLAAIGAAAMACAWL